MEIASISKQEFEVVLKLTESEARALHDIVAYGYEPFIKVFKEKLGCTYIEKNELGCKSLFASIAQDMPSHFARFEEARKVFEGSKYIPFQRK